jgi:hypothetical protein
VVLEVCSRSYCSDGTVFADAIKTKMISMAISTQTELWADDKTADSTWLLPKPLK